MRVVINVGTPIAASKCHGHSENIKWIKLYDLRVLPIVGNLYIGSMSGTSKTFWKMPPKMAESSTG